MLFSLGEAHMLPKMEDLLRQYAMQPEALCDLWGVFCDMHDINDGEPVSAAEGAKFVQYVQGDTPFVQYVHAKKRGAKQRQHQQMQRQHQQMKRQQQMVTAAAATNDEQRSLERSLQERSLVILPNGLVVKDQHGLVVKDQRQVKQPQPPTNQDLREKIRPEIREKKLIEARREVTHSGGGGGAHRVGDCIEVFSESKGKWVRGKIKRIHRDGDLKVEFGTRTRTIKMGDRDLGNYFRVVDTPSVSRTPEILSAASGRR